MKQVFLSKSCLSFRTSLGKVRFMPRDNRFLRQHVHVCRLETVQDFLIKLDIKPLMHLLKISIFSLNKDIVRLPKIMNNLIKDCKIRTFKVIFQCLKLVESFQTFFSVKNIWLGDQLLLMKFFENFDF